MHTVSELTSRSSTANALDGLRGALDHLQMVRGDDDVPHLVAGRHAGVAAHEAVALAHQQAELLEGLERGPRLLDLDRRVDLGGDPGRLLDEVVPARELADHRVSTSA
jgi:hypothetical protein